MTTQKTKFSIKGTQKELRSVLKTMKVPTHITQYMSQHNLLWLQQNLATRNADHPKLDEALFLLNQLIKTDKQ
jgi:hypothetical protein